MKKLIFSSIISCISLVSFAQITGPNSVCVGATINLTDATTGGTWSSHNNAIATVGSTGIVTGVTPGVDTIVYTGGTGTIPDTHIVTVNPLPAPILGGSSTGGVCAGHTLTLTDATTGGSWSSSNNTVATIGSSTGVVTALTPGTTTITYTLPTGCSVTTTIFVQAGPAAITGPDSVCAGATITLTDATTGGTWSSSNVSVATVGSSTGIVTGVSGGTTTISYTLSDGCSATLTVTVKPTPCTSGINESAISNHSVQVYPNPAYDELSIKTDHGDYHSFIITNEVGQVMLRSPLLLPQTTVDIRMLPSGLYYIIFTGDSERTAQKFVKM